MIIMPEEEWIMPWARKLAACTDVAEAKDLLEEFMKTMEVRDSFCDDCEERMPDEPERDPNG